MFYIIRQGGMSHMHPAAVCRFFKLLYWPSYLPMVAQSHSMPLEVSTEVFGRGFKYYNIDINFSTECLHVTSRMRF